MARKKSTTEIKLVTQSQPDWDSMFQILHEPAMIVSPDFNIIYANQASSDAFGLTKQEFKGRHCYEVFHGMNAPVTDCPLKKLLASGRAETADIEVEMLHGNYRVSCTPILDESGKIQSIIHLATDITQRVRAEQALRESEAHYRLLADHMTDTIWLMDLNLKFTYVSPSLEKIRGYTLAELQQLPFEQLLSPASFQLAMGYFEVEFSKAVADPAYSPTLTMELEFYRKDGTIYFCESKVSMVRDENGNPISILGQDRDITERKQIEQVLRESQALLSNAFNTSSLLMTISDLSTGKYLEVNDSFCMVSEFSREEAVGKTSIELGWLDAEQRTQMVHELQRTGKVTGLELALQTKSGKAIICRYSGDVIQTSQGTKLFSTAEDITELKQIEEKLREERQRLAGIIKGTDAGTWEWNIQTGETIYNDRWAEIIGYTLDEISPISIQTWLKYAHPDDIKISQELLKKHFRGELDYYKFESRMKHKDGSWVWVLDRGKVTSWTDDGKPLIMMGTHQDFTERKLAEEQLKETLSLLRIAEEAAKLGGWSVDLENNRSTWSDQVAVIHEMPVGFSPSVEEGINFYAPEWREKIAKVFGDCAQKGIPYNEEMEIITANGKRVWVHTMGEAVRDEEGKIYKVQGAFQDISQRKQAETSLRENQELFALFMHHSPIYTFIKEVTSSESRVLQASDNYEEMIGIPGREMIGKTMFELFDPESAAKFTADDWAVVSSGQVLKLNEDLNDRHYSTIKFPILQGNKTLLAGYTIDITERVRAEQEIQKLAQHYQALIEKAPDGIVLLNEQGNFKFVSPSARKMFGYAVSDEIKGNPAEFTHPDDLPLVLSEMSRMFADQSYVPTLQYRFIDKSGNWIWVESTFSNLLSDPSIESIVINFRDISERKQAEEKMIVSETRYRRLFEAAKDGILILDADTGMILDANPFLLELLDSSKEEIYGKELWELGYFKDIAANKSNFLQLQENGYLRYEDLPLETAQGRRLNVEFVSNVYQVNHHKVIQCNIRDITERKQAEKNLRQSEQTLRSFITNSPDTIYVLDLENHTNKYLNSAEFCGYPKSVLESRTSIMFALSPEDIPIVQENWKQMLRAGDGEVTSCEYRLQRKDGVWEWIQQRMTIISRTVNGAPSQVLVTLSIITERKQIEEKIHQLNLDLEQRVEERTRELRDAQEQLVRHEKLAVLGQMASSVGHELRNPLAVITSAIYYLKMVQPDADEKIKEYLGVIDQEVHTSEKIITDLLDFARIKSVDREAVSVFDLVRQTFERFPVPASVDVTIDIPTDLPRAYVDLRQMIQVLGNLTVNACQAMTGSSAMPKGGQLSLYSRLQNDMINIEVKDTGVGITPENMKKLFEPLFTTKAKGIGLGLAVSRKLIEANGGRIEVESEAGKGSSFSVYLPIDKELK